MFTIILTFFILSLAFIFSATFPAASLAASLHWESCLNKTYIPWFESDPPPGLNCSYLNVPMKYENGNSIASSNLHKSVKIALTLLPAKGARKGTLVMISGGPGQPGINPTIASDPPASSLNEKWDIVGYDPRGVGQSLPKVKCPLPNVIKNSTTTEEEFSSAIIRSCMDNTDNDMLKHIGSDEAVSDLDRIRQALGEQKLTAMGSSYGTQIAALYAERFPDSVRALVLDGVVNLEDAKDDFTWELRQAEGYQQTFERFARWCDATGSCPLSSNAALATQQYRNILARLESQRLFYGNKQKVTSYDLIGLTTKFLLWRSDWPKLATAVRQLDAGIVSNEINKELTQADKEISDVSSYIINCADQSSFQRSFAEMMHRRQLIRNAFPAVNYRTGNELSLNLCDIWPWRNDVHFKRPASRPALPPLLFVAQRYDPTTPWQNARSMATSFNSPLLTLEGDGHTMALGGHNACVDINVVDYIMNPEKARNDIICR
ncbi:alpha/beta fold hydrolase [Pantoea agglomerans]